MTKGTEDLSEKLHFILHTYGPKLNNADICFGLQCSYIDLTVLLEAEQQSGELECLGKIAEELEIYQSLRAIVSPTELPKQDQKQALLHRILLQHKATGCIGPHCNCRAL